MTFLGIKEYNVDPEKLPRRLMISNVVWVFLLAGLMILILLYFPIQEKIEGRVEIFYQGIPVQVKARQDGILNLFVQDGEEVKKDQLIGLHEWDITHDNFKNLTALSRLSILTNDKVSIKNLEDYLSLFSDKNIPYLQGEISAVTSALSLFHTQNQYEAFNSFLNAQKNRINSLENNKDIQKSINTNRILQNEIIRGHISKDSLLLQEGIISEREFELNSRRYMEELIRIEQGSLDIERNDESIEGINATVELEKYQLELIQIELYRNLVNALEDYKKAFFKISEDKKIVSPLSGKVEYADLLNFTNNIAKGSEILIVRPVDEVATRMARIKTGNRNTGRIVKDARVMIMLDQYPIDKYGVIYASIQTKRSLPENDEYLFGLSLENGLITSYDIKLEPQPVLSGQGQILLEKVSILELIHNELMAQKEVLLARS